MDVEEPHAPHKPHTGHRWLDVLLGITAVIVSGVSLSVAIHHGHIMEKLVEANSFPSIELEPVVDSSAGGGSGFGLAAENSGTGPARIESLEIWIDQTPITSSRQLLEAVLPADARSRGLEARIEGGSVVGRLLGASRRNEFFKVTPVGRDQWDVSPEILSSIHTRLCYCSVFDECYVTDSRVRDGRPAHVEQCAIPLRGYEDGFWNAGRLQTTVTR